MPISPAVLVQMELSLMFQLAGYLPMERPSTAILSKHSYMKLDTPLVWATKAVIMALQPTELTMTL